MMRKVKRLGLSIFVLLSFYGCILIFPEVLFAHTYTFRNFEVYSDRPISSDIESVLNDAKERITRSELYTDQQSFKIFLANERWRLALFTRNNNVGGVCHFNLTRNVFIRECDIASNSIVAPNSWKFPLKDRPLSYFIAHELTHSMQSRHDRWLNFKTPVHILEGYADYIGKSKEFDYDHYLSDFRNGEPIMNPENGLYNRYHLFVAYLIDRKKMTFQNIIEENPNLVLIENEMNH